MGTFLTGLFAVLPVVVTLWIMGWAAEQLQAALGPESIVGRQLRSLGMQFVGNETFATIVGWVFVLIGIWLLGVLVRATTRYRLEEWFDALMKRIPLVKSVYGPISQVVSMFQRQDRSEMSGMPVVYCSFGEGEDSGFLALLASPDTFRFGEKECHVVYIPTSPLPMSGGIVFVPKQSVRRVDMEVEQLMQIYFSLGVMSSNVVPAKYTLAAS
ncbi:MAG TPA: DUF502 domain-containing protein [Planctomycetaceae bacterium]|nr:DUF502 domain-containing protein [Planctomycetaceae bacterium]